MELIYMELIYAALLAGALVFRAARTQVPN
jgi:hypothetical protein